MAALQTTEESISGLYANIGTWRDLHDFLVTKFQDHTARVHTATNVATGKWYTEWPDLSQTPEAPTVANQVELGIRHWMAIGGSLLPSIRVPLNQAADQRTEKPAARKRERRLRELWESSNMSELSALAWGDYAGAGNAIVGAWVNFEEEDPAKRNPYAVRFDPRHAFVLKDDLGNVTTLHVARKISKEALKSQYKDSPWLRRFDKAPDEMIEEWFWYTKDRVILQIVDVSKDGKTIGRNVSIVDEEWDLGFVPVWEAVMPTFDGERRGVFDQAIHILRTMQRLMLMTIMSTEEHAFPAVASYDAINPEDFGPGAVIQLRSSEGKVERLGPSAHFDVKDLVARLGDEAGKQAVYPQQLVGQPGASIVSARGINASMGALDARLALGHKQFEVLFSKVSGYLLAMDEVFCDGEKTIVGDTRDTSKAEEYRPSKDVAGHWLAKATYGIGAGSDPANIEIRLSMHLANGLLSKTTARQHLPYLEDPDAEELLILREQMQQSMILGILTKAQQGDPSMAAKALSMMHKDTVNVDKLVEDMAEALMAPPPQQAGPGGPQDALGALQGAESVARGGIPGQAAQAPPGLGLPPLGNILNQASRQVS